MRSDKRQGRTGELVPLPQTDSSAELRGRDGDAGQVCLRPPLCCHPTEVNETRFAVCPLRRPDVSAVCHRGPRGTLTSRRGSGSHHLPEEQQQPRPRAPGSQAPTAGGAEGKDAASASAPGGVVPPPMAPPA